MSRWRELFWKKVDKAAPNGCWMWTGSLSRDGYGQHSTGRRAGEIDTRNTHRISWILLRGPIPRGLTIDHLCRNRACCNPEHLEPVPLKTNLHRGNTIPRAHALRTHCPQGHPYSDENTYRHKGRRYCRTCMDFYVQRRRTKATTHPSKGAKP